jgi:DNA repair protein RAD57
MLLLTSSNSGAGKTQFLLTLLLSSQLPQPHGLSAPSLYISTEAALSTSRLAQLLRQNPIISSLPLEQRPSLNKILSIQTPDLEAQDHILRFQVPVAIERQGIRLVVIDSIASNYRAEFDRTGVGSVQGQSQGNVNPDRRAAQAMAERRTQLVQLGGFLRNLAREKNIAIVLSNQVADRFSPITAPPPHTQLPSQNHLPPPSTSSIPVITPDPLTLDHQQRWFTGWGDLPGSNYKTPSLGLVWTNQIGARIALIKEGDVASVKRRRWLRVVFAPWVGGSRDCGLEYEILGEGVRAVGAAGDDVDEAGN